ncbi:hypothetical protein [Labrys sp. WJW]|uniref:hypothetical protein n=1 Tax=Labrys sp. WJW TaxID=1737983 RepID=UPI0012E9C47D|nr:hypothetical protein [Labrys sp. WJW]
MEKRRATPTLKDFGIVAAILAGIVAIGSAHSYITHYGETPEQVAAQARQAAVDAQAAKDRQSARNALHQLEKAKLDRLCPAELACAAFSSARQECATAGDFQNCLSVKLGDDSKYAPYCTNDGNLNPASVSEELPNYARCVTWKYANWLL